MSDKREQVIRWAFRITGTVFFVVASITILQIWSSVGEIREVMSILSDFPIP
jgi:hypothetical protein